MKIGIIFGGPSREREIAFAGGRTVYDNLNKSLFEPVPLFVDSLRNFILLEWQYIYKGTIRDFYPPAEAVPPSPNNFQIYIESLGKLTQQETEKLIRKVGRKVDIAALPEMMDVAFLALHGEFGEDGQIQGLLESMNIPYTGSGIRACSIGMDKAFQKKVMEASGFACPNVLVLERRKWIEGDLKQIFKRASKKLGFPMVIRPANQGSSIGVAIIDEEAGLSAFEKFVNRAFFREIIQMDDWQKKTKKEKVNYIWELTDIRVGLGFPLNANGHTLYHPEELLTFLDGKLLASPLEKKVVLESHLSEEKVILEAFISGKEFSCIVIRKETGEAVALPPTEIVKGGEIFDYRSKYLPGFSRKVTPVNLPGAKINAIRKECERLFEYLEFNTYARIDGFISSPENEDSVIYLNDPNTTSGMLPSSFFFHQTAEIGLTPSQFLTFIIRTSLQERIATSVQVKHYQSLLEKLDAKIELLKTGDSPKKKIAVIMGGYSFERHISVESGRNIFEKLASSKKYEPLPIFLLGNSEKHDLYQIPINLLLKDNADDIRDKILTFKKHPLVEQIKKQCREITEKYASKDVIFEPKKMSYPELGKVVAGVFIALHGRPGEDGEVQVKLDALGIPYNGSGVDSSSITINKFKTLQCLKQHGFCATHQLLVFQNDFIKNKAAQFEKIEKEIAYPLVAKPVDEGCSSAVKVLKNREEVEAYLNLMFRKKEAAGFEERALLGLKPQEEFPRKKEALLEAMVLPNGAKHFLEITGGLLTHHEGDFIRYEVFEPSEVLASGEVLSLEEKFLAGEGQNITPARFAKQKADYAFIAQKVKAEFERAARLLKVQGYARIDAFVRIYENRRVETIIIEVNSLPGMTPATCIYHQAALNGYKPFEFIDKILEFGFERKALES